MSDDTHVRARVGRYGKAVHAVVPLSDSLTAHAGLTKCSIAGIIRPTEDEIDCPSCRAYVRGLKPRSVMP